jgi:hypothetical protein
MKARNTLLFLFVSVLMIGCGGGSDETTTPPTSPANVAPTANAGIDQSVNEEVLVTLSGIGTDSDGSISSYQWSQTTGTTVSMSDSASASLTFTAPSLTETTTLAFELTITDDEGSTAKDVIQVIVNPINAAPIADAGPDQFVDEITSVTIVGLAEDSDGEVSSYQWSQVSGPTVLLINEEQANLEVRVPSIDEDSEVVLELKVIDNEGLSITDTVVIEINNVESLLIGRFIDSAVEGATYRTETRVGITNSNGEFHYLTGETVVFGLGDLEFPATAAAQILTPLELVGVSDMTDIAVVNMARLLQSLDKDCNPDNGITISGEVLLAATGMEIDFNDPDFDSQVVTLVENAGQEDPSCRVLIDAEQAISHLQETLNELDNQVDPPIGGGLAGKVGIWEGEGQQTGISWTISIDVTLNEQLIEYPSLECGGFLTLLEESDTQLLFKETITFGTGCVDQGFVELTDKSSNELTFHYYWPGSDEEMGELGAIGTLTRKE